MYFHELFVLDLCSYRCVCNADKGNFIISKFLTTMVISEQYLTWGNGYGLPTNDAPKICGLLGPLPLIWLLGSAIFNLTNRLQPI